MTCGVWWWWWWHQNPSEQKFRAVNIEKTRAKLEPAAGAVDYLMAAGFKKTATHYELPTDFDLEVLSAYHSALAAQDSKAAQEFNDSLSAEAKASLVRTTTPHHTTTLLPLA